MVPRPPPWLPWCRSQWRPLAFTLLFAIGGTAPVETGKVLTAMVGWHVLIGIGEAVVTGARGRGVMTARPDLVYGARHLLAANSSWRSGEAATAMTKRTVLLRAPARRTGRGRVRQLLREHPPRRTRVRRRADRLHRLGRRAETADGPFADYQTKGVDDERLGGGIAGASGSWSCC